MVPVQVGQAPDDLAQRELVVAEHARVADLNEHPPAARHRVSSARLADAAAPAAMAAPGTASSRADAPTSTPACSPASGSAGPHRTSSASQGPHGAGSAPHTPDT